MKHIHTFESFINEGIELVSMSDAGVSNFNKKDTTKKHADIEAVLLDPETWTDDLSFKDKQGNVYFIDDLLNKDVKIGGKIIKVEEGKLNEYGAKPGKSTWLGWFVLTGNLRGDLNSWKKGELIKAYVLDDKDYVFIETGDNNYEAYDEINKADFDRVAEPLDKDKHKKSYNYVETLKKSNQLKDWEKID